MFADGAVFTHWALKSPSDDETIEPDKRFRLNSRKAGAVLRMPLVTGPGGFLLRSDVMAMVVAGFLSAERYHVHSHSHFH
jgi:hypothetical protein